MKRATIYHTVIMAASIVMMSACGGGGGESQPPVTQPPVTQPPVTQPPVGSEVTLSISASNQSLEIGEGDQSTVSLSADYTGDLALTYSIENSNESIVDAKITDKVLTLTASQLDVLDPTVKIKVIVTDGDKRSDVEVSVAVINTSFWLTYNSLSSYADSIVKYVESDSSVYNVALFYTDVDYRTGLINKDGYTNLTSSIYVETINSANKLISDSSDAYEALKKLSTNPDATESDLQQYSDKISLSVKNYVSASSEILNSFYSISEGLLPKVTLNQLVPVNNSFSLFVGNESMGSGVTSSWLFNETFKFMESMTSNNTQICASGN